MTMTLETERAAENASISDSHMLLFWDTTKRAFVEKITAMNKL